MKISISTQVKMLAAGRSPYGWVPYVLFMYPHTVGKFSPCLSDVVFAAGSAGHAVYKIFRFA